MFFSIRVAPASRKSDKTYFTWLMWSCNELKKSMMSSRWTSTNVFLTDDRIASVVRRKAFGVFLMLNGIRNKWYSLQWSVNAILLRLSSSTLTCQQPLLESKKGIAAASPTNSIHFSSNILVTSRAYWRRVTFCSRPRRVASHPFYEEILSAQPILSGPVQYLSLTAFSPSLLF